MDSARDWPAYQAGPKESIFAMGVASVNYARLEYALSTLFATVMDMDAHVSALKINEVRNNKKILASMKQGLAKTGWPDCAKEAVDYFLLGYKICADNRNLLMHSTIIGAKYAILLYKRNRSGVMTVCRPTLEDLRRTADDARTYLEYGLNLSKVIKARLDDWSLPTLPIPWPIKPDPPQPLPYST